MAPCTNCKSERLTLFELQKGVSRADIYHSVDSDSGLEYN